MDPIAVLIDEAGQVFPVQPVLPVLYGDVYRSAVLAVSTGRPRQPNGPDAVLPTESYAVFPVFACGDGIHVKILLHRYDHFAVVIDTGTDILRAVLGIAPCAIAPDGHGIAQILSHRSRIAGKGQGKVIIVMIVNRIIQLAAVDYILGAFRNRPVRQVGDLVVLHVGAGFRETRSLVSINIQTGIIHFGRAKGHAARGSQYNVFIQFYVQSVGAVGYHADIIVGQVADRRPALDI